jgi:hypothetical protein
MIPYKTYPLTLKTGAVTVVFVRYTESGFFECTIDGILTIVDTLTVIGFTESEVI